MPYGGDNPIKKEALKFDDGKARMDLIPPESIWALADVYSYGAHKYQQDRNWELGIKYSRIYAAMLRHLLAWWGGEDDDLESGLHHMAHAMWGCAAILAFDDRKDKYEENLDDRPK